MKYIASCSFGKDSLAMILRLLDEKKPLDEVIFYNTGVEFRAVYDIRDKVIPLLEKSNIAYIELYPQNPFLYDMLDRPVRGRDTKGYGWCGGVCRWGTANKKSAIDKYKAQYKDIVEYVGIAADETHRIKDKTYPLVEWGMTEADCLQYCYDRGYEWLENGIRLYDILDRVSCWCCANKNLKELKNMYQYLPCYWERLKLLQSEQVRPLKGWYKGHSKGVFELEQRFKAELAKEVLECEKP